MAAIIELKQRTKIILECQNKYNLQKYEKQSKTGQFRPI